MQAALDATPAGSTIRLCAETYQETITITKNLTLLGLGSGTSGTLIDGQGAGTVVIGPGSTVILQALQITGSGSGTVLGGGIDTSGNLTLTDCLVTGNHARECGGGIFNTGSLTLAGATVSSNTSEVDGGGICSLDAGTVTLLSSTVNSNTVGRSGGGILNGGISVTLDAASVVENNEPDNCAGNPVSGCTG